MGYASPNTRANPLANVPSEHCWWLTENLALHQCSFPSFVSMCFVGDVERLIAFSCYQYLRKFMILPRTYCPMLCLYENQTNVTFCIELINIQ